jgi:hypothetical protein
MASKTCWFSGPTLTEGSAVCGTAWSPWKAPPPLLFSLTGQGPFPLDPRSPPSSHSSNFHAMLNDPRAIFPAQTSLYSELHPKSNSCSHHPKPRSFNKDISLAPALTWLLHPWEPLEFLSSSLPLHSERQGRGSGVCSLHPGYLQMSLNDEGFGATTVPWMLVSPSDSQIAILTPQ